MRGKLIRDLSATTLQVMLNHSIGVIVFLLISIYLSKDSYGELNWSIAVFTFANSFLSFRLEQIVVQKVASEHDSSKIMTLHLIHVLLTGVGFYIILFFLSLAFPLLFASHNLLIIVGISQLLNFLSLPFKQVANGKERFDYLAFMSSINNLVRLFLLLAIIFFYYINIEGVLAIFIVASFIELLVSFYLIVYKMHIPLTHLSGIREYRVFLRESLPQIGSAILMAAITRMDWILLGIYSTSTIVAEYSFAYRLYELSPVPLLIVAPLLLSRFSKYFASNKDKSLLDNKRELIVLIKAEMVAATLLPLILNLLWVPVFNFLTNNKYGSSNRDVFLILSFCVPFQYITNIIWSVHLAKNRLRLILRITLVTFFVAALGDLIFIPQYGAKAAAVVFLVAMITEYINYLRSSELIAIRESWLSPLVCLAAAVVSGFAGTYCFNNPLNLLVALPLFFLILRATGQLTKSDLVFVLQMVRKKKT